MTKIITDPKIMLGKPTIKGTRITVEQILKLLAQKFTIEEILDDFPQLVENDITEAVNYAAKSVASVHTNSVKYLHEIHR